MIEDHEEQLWHDDDLPRKHKRRSVYDDINTSYFDEGGDEDDL